MIKPVAVTGSRPVTFPKIAPPPPKTVVLAATEVATLDASMIDCDSDTFYAPLKNPKLIKT